MQILFSEFSSCGLCSFKKLVVFFTRLLGELLINCWLLGCWDMSCKSFLPFSKLSLNFLTNVKGTFGEMDFALLVVLVSQLHSLIRLTEFQVLKGWLFCM